MTRPIRPISLDGISTYAIADRKSKVDRGDFARPWTAGGTFTQFIAGLPGILAGSQLKEITAAVAVAARARRTVMMGMGAHVIKVGLNPVLIDLMDRGIVTCLSMNGAGIIHDTELAMTGRTSEDVAAALGDGGFGMARETGAFLSEAVQRARREGLGLGRAVGDAVNAAGLPYAGESLLAAGAARDIPVTVHVAIGTDIIHMHPQFDPAAAGAASHLDFRTFAGAVATLEGGVYLNVGSAVILPEVFLKALTLVRNLGHTVDRFTTVNLDFIQHYRPATNVVHRPTLSGGRGYSLTGHHEILLPLIAAGVVEALDRR